MSEAETESWASRARERARRDGYACRPAAPSDADAMADVHVQVWRATYAGLMDADFLAAMDVGRLSSGWRRAIDAHDARIAVGTDPAGRVVGFGSAGPSRDEDALTAEELYALNVLPSCHGTGLAHLLVELVINPGPCSLWVAVGNARAEAFYWKYGFADEGRTMADERLGVVEKRMVRGPEAPPPGEGPGTSG